MMTKPKKPRQAGRGYHSRSQRTLQCSMWASLTLISCGQDLVTRYIAGPSARIITSLKMWRQNGDFEQYLEISPFWKDLPRAQFRSQWHV
jgi:hypothetical protein